MRRNWLIDMDEKILASLIAPVQAVGGMFAVSWPINYQTTLRTHPGKQLEQPPELLLFFGDDCVQILGLPYGKPFGDEL